MKEIKTYIRKRKAEEVMCAIEQAGVSGFTAVEVKALGCAVEPEKAKYSIEYAERFSPITKIEVVCNDEDVPRLVDIIREAACTGHRGDGMIFVSDVSHAIKIRAGEWGEGALLPGPETVLNKEREV